MFVDDRPICVRGNWKDDDLKQIKRFISFS